MKKDRDGLKLLAWTLVGIGLTALASAACLAVVIRLIDGQGSWWKIPEHHLGQGDWFEAARVTVTLVALTVAGGAAYLAYRRQRTADENQKTAAQTHLVTANTYQLSLRQREDLRRGELRQRFSDAAAQLANSSAAVRIAGVYAMTAVANDWHSRQESKEVQTCVDVLVGYLRLPYDPVHGASHLTKRVFTSAKTTSADGEDIEGTEEKHYEYRQQDREVRQTIVRTIASHVQAGARPSWAALRYDFRNAIFEEANFERAEFSGGVDFSHAVFFEGVSFNGAQFGTSSFKGSLFHGESNFQLTKFEREADFSNAIFHTGRIEFDRAEFRDVANFDSVTFNATAAFSDARFGKDSHFEFSNFGGEAIFSAGTVFKGDALFFGATFTHRATFGKIAANVGGGIFVEGSASFEKEAWFSGARFEGYADFRETSFGKLARFENTQIISHHTSKGGAVFNGGACFDGANFRGGASFIGTDFGTKDVSFRSPAGWTNVQFDWDEDQSLKPVIVKPNKWPPINQEPRSASHAKSTDAPS